MKSKVGTEPNYTEPDQSGQTARVERAGDVTGESPANVATDRTQASKLANLLEGIRFPATKEEIRRHVNMKSPLMGNGTNEVMGIVEDKLDERATYSSSYDVELAAGLVDPVEDTKDRPYVRDRALNRANSRRLGEKVRPDPYEERKESTGVASARDVSPNTPRGESV